MRGCSNATAVSVKVDHARATAFPGQRQSSEPKTAVSAVMRPTVLQPDVEPSYLPAAVVLDNIQLNLGGPFLEYYIGLIHTACYLALLCVDGRIYFPT